MKLYVVMMSEDRGNTWSTCRYPLGGVVSSENLKEAKQQLEMEYKYRRKQSKVPVKKEYFKIVELKERAAGALSDG